MTLARTIFLIVALATAALAQQPDVSREVALARSAAPSEISKDATVYIFSNGKYILHEKGTNGFSCFVLRDNDPRSLYPACLDAEWMRCQFPEYEKDAELRHQGMAEDRIEAELLKMRREGRFPNPTRSGIAYMASPSMRGGFEMIKDGLIQPHVMIFVQGVTNAQIGVSNIGYARAHHIPFVAFEGLPTAHIITPLMTYSDGTPFKDADGTGTEGAHHH